MKFEKKYTCFVCGQILEDFDEFKTHIIESHEEGREFVKCPLSHCEAPVRDLRMHFKVKHKNFDFNKIKGQMKAIIWHDFSSKGKKTRKPKFKQGRYQSTKSGKVFLYRSGLEKKTFEILDKHEDVMSYDAEPFQIDYIYKGQAHKYIPDILVHFIDGKKEVWEVKPSDQTDLEINKCKWRAAEEACQVRNWAFQVYTEQRINKLEKQVKNQIID